MQCAAELRVSLGLTQLPSLSVGTRGSGPMGTGGVLGMQSVLSSALLRGFIPGSPPFCFPLGKARLRDYGSSDERAERVCVHARPQWSRAACAREGPYASCASAPASCPPRCDGSRIPNARFLEPERSQARASRHCTQGPGAPALRIPRAQPPQSKPEFPSCLTPPRVPCHSQSEPFPRPCFATTPHRAAAVAVLSTRVANSGCSHPEAPAPSSSPELPPAAGCSHAPSLPLSVTAPSSPILSSTCPHP